MARKGINIYKRKDGRWEGRYRVFLNEIDNYKYYSVYGKTYTEAREKLELRKSEKTIPNKKCVLTVENLFNLLLENIKNKVKASTLANYRFKLNKHILPAFGFMKYDKVNATIVNDFINKKLKQGLSEKYIKDILSLLKALEKYALKMYGYKNPFADDVISIKPKVKETVCYTKKSQLKFVNSMLKDMDLTKIGILLSYYTGIRIGELCALQW